MPDHLICLHEEKWQNLEKELSEIKAMQKELQQKLFIGNGTEALMPMVKRHDNLLSAVVTAFSVIILAAITTGLGTWFWHLFRLNAHGGSQ